MKTTIIALLFILALVSCQKVADPVFTEKKDLIGSWTDPEYTDTLITYTRAESLVKNHFGVTFKPDNKLIERQLNGWCGTPPTTTADYEGTWKTDGSIVIINVGYWGGTADYTWRIMALNNQKLVISIVKADYNFGL